ncbi:hypothetical protein [Sphaerothrix gracilis]|uniref:hypothetical protein n=1 Tax=Sphaerothrix gracilis TaxID=3151835 RepID=UPI0031FDCB43
MLNALFDRLGNWNPQLLRELKGRLRPRNLIAAIAISAISQLILLSFFGAQLPPQFNPHEHLRLTTLPEINFTFGTSDIPNYPPNLRVEGLNYKVGNIYQGGTEPAENERLEVRDRIWEINGQTIDTFYDSYEEVNRALQGIAANRPVLNSSAVTEDVTLRVERPGVGQLTLQIPRAAVLDTYSPYCIPDSAANVDPYHYRGSYGSNLCQLNSEKTAFVVNWSAWHQDVFRWSSLMLVVGLLAAGSFVLIQNLEREQRRGTLTFIRLSPRSSLNILTGQILGAPIAIYIAAALMLPLHIVSALRSGVSAIELVAFYSLLGVAGCFFFSLSLLLGLVSKGLGGLLAWLVAAGIFLLQLFLGIAVSEGNLGNPFTLHWLILFSPASALHFLLGFAEKSSSQEFQFATHKLTLLSFVGLFWVNGVAWSLWLWHALRRKFVNPQVPLLQRRYSYLMTVCFEVFLLGFAVSSGYYQEDIALVAFLNVLFLGLLIAALQPSRQTLEDWARFRLSEQRSQRQPLIKDLVQGENSPAILAMGLNIAIALGFMTIWTAHNETFSLSYELLSYIALGGLLLIYASINQVWFLTPVNRPEVWSLGTLLVLMIAPLFARLLLEEVAALTSVQFLEAVAVPWMMNSAMGSYGWAILSQWLLICLLNLVTLRQLRKAGESGSKDLLAPSRTALPSKAR